MRTVIVTVGTSLLTNNGWKLGQVLPDLDATVTTLQKADATQATAETNTLARLPLRERETDRLAWLHSDTPEGRLCATVLHAHYTALGYAGRLYEIKGLGYHGATFAERGLRNLLAETFTVIKEAGGSAYVTLCATGGFKAQIAYLNLVGLLLGIDVYYIHELFRELVSLPRLPLDWDTTWVRENEAFFQWIDEEQRPTPEVEGWLRAQPDLRPLVADDADGHSYLTPAGDLLYRVFKERSQEGPRATWPPASPRAPHEKVDVSKEEHHRPKGWQQWVKRLTEIDCVTMVRFEDTGAGYGGECPRVEAIKGKDGALVVVAGQTGNELPLRVETTARNEEELNLVRTWIERNMRKW